ncbi:MAG: alkaline phosphatase D family protein [Planctomycetota bacterium]|nr:alkaline phosphatase D family protein [Planctomycetota bacterium]
MSLLPIVLSALLLTSADTLAGDTVPGLSAGPMVGAVESGQVRIWCRATDANQKIEATLIDAEGAELTRTGARSTEDRDLTVELILKAQLRPGHRYRYRVLVDGVPVADGADQIIVGPAQSNGRSTLVFGSCANPKRYGEGQIWQQIGQREPDAMVFIGDTPYIDTTDLNRQRAAYRKFWQNPFVAALIRRVPVLGTWDDHDYGRNDSVGNIPGRANSRQAFAEYHALGPIGDGAGGGVYSKHRIGPIELFILDTRWYGQTEPSPFDEDRPTLLGAAQWKWLQQGLESSRAPFKIITCGMIFNGATRPNKVDHWGYYPHERQALLDHIRENAISGVLMVTGDIHRTRHLSYPGEGGAGYPFEEWITSPLANSVIDAANAPHPSLVFDGGETSVFLHVEADATGSEPQLRCQLIRGTGEVIHEKAYRLSYFVADSGSKE